MLISTCYFFASFYIEEECFCNKSILPNIIFFFFKMYLWSFFCTFSGKIKKQEKFIILMYCLYESINKHNADIDFFVHALAMFWDQNQKNRSKIDDVIILQNLDSKLKKMSITSKIPEISKIPYKQKCLRIRYYTQYWNFRSIEWLVNMWTHKVRAPLNHLCVNIEHSFSNSNFALQLNFVLQTTIPTNNMKLKCF